MDIVTDVNLSLLNSIPKSDYPQLFLEDVQYMRVLTIACSQNDLVSLSAEIETFISKFPQSDRVPILSRLREDLGPPSSSNENGPAIKGSK